MLVTYETAGAFYPGYGFREGGDNIVGDSSDLISDSPLIGIS